MYISRYFMFPIIAILLAYDIYQKYVYGYKTIDDLFIKICWFILTASLSILATYIHITDSKKAAKKGLTLQQYRKLEPYFTD